MILYIIQNRGIQYFSNQYKQILKREKINISMTEENYCYENAMAERVNGILKSFISTKPLIAWLMQKKLQKMQLIYTTK